MKFNPAIGPILRDVFETAPGILGTPENSGEDKPPLVGCSLLMDSGASITCIAQDVAKQLKLRPSGKLNVSVPTGLASANTYFVDLGIPFGNAGEKIQTFALKNVMVMEFATSSQHFQGLLGRDVLCRGLFTMTGWDNRVTFCL